MPIWISDLDLIPLKMFDLRCAIWIGRKSQIPDSKLVLDCVVLCPIPHVEIAKLKYSNLGDLPKLKIWRMEPILCK